MKKPLAGPDRQEAEQVAANGLLHRRYLLRKGLTVGETVVSSGTLFIDRAASRD